HRDRDVPAGLHGGPAPVHRSGVYGAAARVGRKDGRTERRKDGRTEGREDGRTGGRRGTLSGIPCQGDPVTPGPPRPSRTPDLPTSRNARPSASICVICGFP